MLENTGFLEKIFDHDFDPLKNLLRKKWSKILEFSNLHSEK